MKKALFILMMLIHIEPCIGQVIDSVNMNCNKLFYYGKYVIKGRLYHCYLVQFIFENHSFTHRTFITDAESVKNFIKSDIYYFTVGPTSANNVSNKIEPNSKFRTYKIILVPDQYLKQGVKFDFIWISEEEYQTNKYDQLIKVQKAILNKKIRTLPEEERRSANLFAGRNIDRHFKFDLIIKEKKKLRKDLFTCELALEIKK